MYCGSTELLLGIHIWPRVQDAVAFWKLHDYLFGHQKDLTAQNLQSNAENFLRPLKSVDIEKLRRCERDNSTTEAVQSDITTANSLGVTATPTFFVNGVRYEGAKTFAQILDIVQQAKPTVSPILDETESVRTTSNIPTK